MCFICRVFRDTACPWRGWPANWWPRRWRERRSASMYLRGCRTGTSPEGRCSGVLPWCWRCCTTGCGTCCRRVDPQDRLENHPRAGRQSAGARPFFGCVTAAALARNENHGRGRNLRDERHIMACAARHGPARVPVQGRAAAQHLAQARITCGRQVVGETVELAALDARGLRRPAAFGLERVAEFLEQAAIFA